MSKRLQVLFTPADFYALRKRDLSGTTCVVFDILRATTSIVTALAQGAKEVVPVETIEEALEYKKAHPEALLAGERNGFRITRELTGGTDFDLGNSPREFTGARVAGKTIVITTTNGSRALRACAGAEQVLAGSFLNMKATAAYCRAARRLVVVCSGTHEEASYEDTLAAGSFADQVWENFGEDEIADSAQMARHIYLAAKGNLVAATIFAANGRRLLGIPELRDDVAICMQEDTLNLLAMVKQGAVLAAGSSTTHE